MRRAQRRIDAGLIQQLAEQPQRFGFFQAMRLLEQLFHRQGVKAGDALPLQVRFRNSLSLGFPASELGDMALYDLEGVELKGGEALDEALAGLRVGQVHLTPAFMGLLGATGALPLHYTETLADRELYRRDRAARGFLDIFTTRMVALHYGAWKKYRLALQYELDRRERFLPLVLSLAGLGLPGLRERMVDGEGDLFDQAVAYHAGAIRQRPVSAITVQRILGDYFGVPVRVEQFVGAWYRVPTAQRTLLGSGTARLGSTALAGDRVWQRDLRMRLHLGPLDRGHFDAFLPGGAAAASLAKWLTLLLGSSLEYEVRLLLRAEDVRGASLGEHGVRLGWDSYLCTRAALTPRDDTRYELHTVH